MGNGKGNFSNVFFGFAWGGFTVPPPALRSFSEMEPGVGVVLLGRQLGCLSDDAVNVSASTWSRK